MKKQKIIRNSTNTLLAGVCGSLAVAIGVKPKIIRIIYLAFTVITAFLPGILIYLFLMLIIPREA